MGKKLSLIETYNPKFIYHFHSAWRICLMFFLSCFFSSLISLDGSLRVLILIPNELCICCFLASYFATFTLDRWSASLRSCICFYGMDWVSWYSHTSTIPWILISPSSISLPSFDPIRSSSFRYGSSSNWVFSLQLITKTSYISLMQSFRFNQTLI